MARLPVVPRPEYPRPQLVRRDWLCLNVCWQFEIDQGDSGLDRGLLTRPLKDKIIVPFCPESKLSGVENTDYLNAVWYRREVTIPRAWKGRQILRHFHAGDYDSSVGATGIRSRIASVFFNRQKNTTSGAGAPFSGAGPRSSSRENPDPARC